jgi:hypothetical protein
LIYPLLLCLCVAAQPQGSEIDGGELMAILEGLHSKIPDFELVCEGRIGWADGAEKLRKEAASPESFEALFQGSYAYRLSDGAGYLDLYKKRLASSADFTRATYANLKGRLREVVRAAGQRSFPGGFEEKVGAPGALTFQCSPERFIYLYYWRGHQYSTADITCRVEGSEEVDGNPALRLWVDEFPKSNLPEMKWSRYWIDIRRGGHVVRHEFYKGSNLVYRTHSVALGRFSAADGSEVWLPVHGVRDSFRWGTGFSPAPVFHEVYDVVRGSLAFSPGLPDKRFSLDWSGPKPATPAMDEARRAFRSAPRKPDPPARTHPDGVEEDQARRLAEADRQAKQLVASSPDQSWWQPSLVIQAGLICAGAGLLLAAYWLGRRLR